MPSGVPSNWKLQSAKPVPSPLPHFKQNRSKNEGTSTLQTILLPSWAVSMPSTLLIEVVVPQAFRADIALIMAHSISVPIIPIEPLVAATLTDEMVLP